MGFNKRYITKEKILSNIGDIDNLLKSDSLLMDGWSRLFIDDLRPEQRKIRQRILDGTLFSSNLSDTTNHEDFKLLDSLSETLVHLLSDANWIDILMTDSKITIERGNWYGNFDKMKKSSINSIISYYDHKLTDTRDNKIKEITNEK